MILNPLDIKDRDWIKENLSWPINYEELKKYYSASLKLLHKDYFKNVNLFNFQLDEKYISFFSTGKIHRILIRTGFAFFFTLVHIFFYTLFSFFP